jgi:hypothetical protein
MIHLVAGDSALGTLKETSVPGEKFSVDDILVEGPIVDELHSDSSWEKRADYLDRYFSIPKGQYLSGNALRRRILEQSLAHDEIVLWFEFDLHCQANLLYFLNWFASRSLGHTRLSLICPETFPGHDRFRGLGELRGDELESLFPQRAEVTHLQKQTAQLAWQAYGSSDPRAIEKLLQSDTSALPLLAPALSTHLERFPSTANGLGSLGQKTLEILAGESIEFRKLFPRVSGTHEIFRHGMGDLTLLSYLKMWSMGPSPLIQTNGRIEITSAGRAVIENRADAIQCIGIDVWYGGVHFTPKNPWRWDTAAHCLTGIRGTGV